MTICKKQNLLKKLCISILFALLLSIFFAKPVTVQAAADSYYLDMNEYLSSGQQLTSSNGKYFAAMQGDGNFVIYQTSPTVALWHTQTGGTGYSSYRAYMQDDGNFVVYGVSNSLIPVWNSQTRSTVTDKKYCNGLYLSA